METLSFAFGMLAMVAIILEAIVVIGIVKVYKQQTQIRSLEDSHHHGYSDFDRRIDDMETRLDRRFDDLYRELESKIEHVDSEMDTRFSDLTSYTDSRFDKLINKLNVTPATKKDLLKD